MDELKALLPIRCMPAIAGLIFGALNVYNVIYLAGHAAITLIAVVGLCLRLEHRLTKIETDLTWLKQNQHCGEESRDKNEETQQVDSA